MTQSRDEGGVRLRGWMTVLLAGMAVGISMAGLLETRLDRATTALRNELAAKMDALSTAGSIQVEAARRELAGAVAERNAMIQGLQNRIVALESARSNGK